MPFERTVDVLLRLIALRLKADIAVLSTGVSLQRNFTYWVSVPLQAGSRQQELILGWRQAGAIPDVSASTPLIDALRLVLVMNDEESRVHELLAEAARLQWKLADSKIADRTAGLIASGDANPIDVQRHVYRVMASIEDAAAAAGRIAKLNSELEEREQILAAKVVLQRKHALTEEQAYVYLQQASRRSRRTIAEIAAEVCGVEAGAV